MDSALRRDDGWMTGEAWEMGRGCGSSIMSTSSMSIRISNRIRSRTRIISTNIITSIKANMPYTAAPHPTWGLHSMSITRLPTKAP